MSTKRLTKELAQLEKKPLPYCSFSLPSEEDVHKWRARVVGPSGTPYANGAFVIEFVFPAQYPFKPPEVKFLTKIYHPSVKTETGEICSDLINENWSPTLNVRHCVEVLYNMMLNPASDHPLEADIAAQMLEKPKDFEKTATKYTKEFAMAN